jgi:hypothetical protein
MNKTSGPSLERPKYNIWLGDHRREAVIMISNDVTSQRHTYLPLDTYAHNDNELTVLFPWGRRVEVSLLNRCSSLADSDKGQGSFLAARYSFRLKCCRTSMAINSRTHNRIL